MELERGQAHLTGDSQRLRQIRVLEHAHQRHPLGQRIADGSRDFPGHAPAAARREDDAHLVGARLGAQPCVFRRPHAAQLDPQLPPLRSAVHPRTSARVALSGSAEPESASPTNIASAPSSA